VGTETDGSVLCPAGENHIVGLKPTLGLVGQNGIIPISHSQDTAGPMARNVMDVAIMLNAMRSPFGEVARRLATGDGDGQDVGELPADYTRFVRPGALRGARIAVDTRFTDPSDFGPMDAGITAVFKLAVAAMGAAGATIIEVDGGDPLAYLDDEFTVLLYEFKEDIAAYLRPLHNTRMRTLADLIEFNLEHCEDEMKYFGQEVFLQAEATTGTNDRVYRMARANCLRRTRAEGIDRVIREHRVDAIISPTYSWGTSPAAVAGYPSMSVPFALTSEGRPAGVWMWSGFLQEPRLLSLAYALEQVRPAPRATPKFGGTPIVSPDAGICTPSVATRARATATRRAPLRM
jgi:amidase